MSYVRLLFGPGSGELIKWDPLLLVHEFKAPDGSVTKYRQTVIRIGSGSNSYNQVVYVPETKGNKETVESIIDCVVEVNEP